MWVLRRYDRPDDKWPMYVAAPGSRASYTPALEKAQKYRTREQAVHDSCVESETPVNVDDILY
jgi:hypothetical protein